LDRAVAFAAVTGDQREDDAFKVIGIFVLDTDGA